MLVTNKQLLECYLGCNLLAKEKLPINISLRIEILRQNLEPVVQNINYEIDNIKMQYCEKDENENPIFQKNAKNEVIQGAYIFTVEEAKSVNGLITELLSSNIEFIDLKIRMQDFPSDFRISADTLKLIRTFIEL